MSGSYNWQGSDNEDGQTNSWHIQSEEHGLIVHVDLVYRLRVTSFQEEKEILFGEIYPDRAAAMDKGEELLTVAVEEFEADPPSENG